MIHDLPCISNPSSQDVQKTPTQGKVVYTYEAQTNAVAAQTKCAEGAAPKLHKPIVTQKQGSLGKLSTISSPLVIYVHVQKLGTST